MRQRGRQLADDGHPAQVSEIVALLLQLEFGLFASSDVDTRAQ